MASGVVASGIIYFTNRPARLQIGDTRHLKNTLKFAQFVMVKMGEQFNLAFALRRQAYLHFAPVRLPPFTKYQAQLLAAGNQRHNSVVMALQALGKLAYSRPFPSREPLDVQQQQILKMGNTMLA